MVQYKLQQYSSFVSFVNRVWQEYTYFGWKKRFTYLIKYYIRRTNPYSKAHKPVFSTKVVPVTTIPGSVLAGLYTANSFSTQVLLGRSSEILKEVVDELRFENVWLTISISIC